MPLMRASEALMQIFLAEGVEFVFGLPGSTETQFMDSLEDHPEIRFILGLNENIAAGMAVGYARASGKVGIINLHTFAGMGAAMATLLDASRGRIPLLVTAGQSDANMAIREGILSGDLVTIGNIFARWSQEVSSSSNLGLAMRRAFKTASYFPSPGGTVFISLPQTMMNENLDFNYTPDSPSAYSRKQPDLQHVERAADLIIKAQKPVVQLGPSVADSQSIPDVIELVELIGAPVFLPGMRTDMLFPTTHHLFLGAAGLGSSDFRQFSQGTDVTIAIGTQPTIQADNIIQIDCDVWELGKNTAVSTALDGDIKLSLSALNELVKGKISSEYRLLSEKRSSGISEEKKLLEKSRLAKAETERDGIPMFASRIAQELASVLDRNTVIIDESWSHSTDMMQYLAFTEPNSYFRHRGVSIGQGMPLALGVKLAMPDRPVLALIGDGSAAWSCQALWTAAHYNIAVTFIILHNASYRLVKMNKIRQLGEQTKDKTLGLDITEPAIEFSLMARAMGVRSHRAEGPEDLKKVLALTLRSDKPELIEVPVEGKI